MSIDMITNKIIQWDYVTIILYSHLNLKIAIAKV